MPGAMRARGSAAVDVHRSHRHGKQRMVEAEIEAEQVLAENDEAEDDQRKADHPGQAVEGPRR